MITFRTERFTDDFLIDVRYATPTSCECFHLPNRVITISLLRSVYERSNELNKKVHEPDERFKSNTVVGFDKYGSDLFALRTYFLPFYLAE